MNKILIALVLTVVLSGNVFSKEDEHILSYFCQDKDDGYLYGIILDKENMEDRHSGKVEYLHYDETGNFFKSDYVALYQTWDIIIKMHKSFTDIRFIIDRRTLEIREKKYDKNVLINCKTEDPRIVRNKVNAEAKKLKQKYNSLLKSRKF